MDLVFSLEQVLGGIQEEQELWHQAEALPAAVRKVAGLAAVVVAAAGNNEGRVGIYLKEAVRKPAFHIRRQ